jgi:hypothetical protein
MMGVGPGDDARARLRSAGSPKSGLDSPSHGGGSRHSPLGPLGGSSDGMKSPGGMEMMLIL